MKENHEMGSSTLSILVLHGGRMRSVYMGDSMFMICRDQQVLFKAPSLQHRFNCPWQVGV